MSSRFGATNHEHRTRGVADQSLRDAAHEQMADSTSTVCGSDDQTDVERFRVLADFIDDIISASDDLISSHLPHIAEQLTKPVIVLVGLLSRFEDTGDAILNGHLACVFHDVQDVEFRSEFLGEGVSVLHRMTGRFAQVGGDQDSVPVLRLHDVVSSRVEWSVHHHYRIWMIFRKGERLNHRDRADAVKVPYFSVRRICSRTSGSKVAWYRFTLILSLPG